MNNHTSEFRLAQIVGQSFLVRSERDKDKGMYFIENSQTKLMENDTLGIQALPPKIGAIRCFCDHNNNNSISKDISMIMSPFEAYSIIKKQMT